VVVPTDKKKKTLKRKSAHSSDSEYDVEQGVPDIMTSAKKKAAGKKIPQNVVDVPIDNVSFHSPESVLRWRFVFHRRLALERELGKEALECEEVVNLIKEAGLLNTVWGIGDCYEKLVKEFLVNIPEDC
ncbi:envelope-like protein, partial [Trifolium medium]|nr:envelope-like protein [Trifolium medium]